MTNSCLVTELDVRICRLCTVLSHPLNVCNRQWVAPRFWRWIMSYTSLTAWWIWSIPIKMTVNCLRCSMLSSWQRPNGWILQIIKVSIGKVQLWQGLTVGVHDDAVRGFSFFLFWDVIQTLAGCTWQRHLTCLCHGSMVVATCGQCFHILVLRSSRMNKKMTMTYSCTNGPKISL